MSVANQCPVCQARFRGARSCSRCGADLEPLMLLSLEAWRLREASREVLRAGEFERALTFAIRAQEVQATEIGEKLRLLSAWLGLHGRSRSADLRIGPKMQSGPGLRYPESSKSL